MTPKARLERMENGKTKVQENLVAFSQRSTKDATKVNNAEGFTEC